MSYYEDRFVAFLDVLGFAELVKKSASCDETRILLLNITHGIEGGANLNEWNNEPYSLPTNTAKISFANFSDSIIVSVPTGLQGLWSLIFFVHRTFSELALKGVLCRGGVSKGQFYQENNVAFGPALLEAYDLESHIASVPRVLISRSVMNIASEYAVEDAWASESLKTWIRRDEDGPAYIDQFADFKKLFALGDVDYNTLYLLRADEIRKSIEGQLFDNVDRPRVFRKYVWIASEYNNMVSRCKATASDLEFINIYDCTDKGVTVQGPLDIS